MNAFASECSSGCESGWTLYLEHSNFLNQNNASRTQFMGEDDDDDDDGFYDESKERKAKSVEEDLSMVSDASSGPPHLPEHESCYLNAHQDDSGCFYPASKAAKLAQRSKKRQKLVTKENNQRLHQDQQQQQHLPSVLDDTASSPVFDFSMNNAAVTNQQTSTESMLDYSQGFSATCFEGRSSLQEHYGFLQPHLSENEVRHGNKWYGGKGMGMM